MDLSVVIPCYNEQESLRETHKRVKTACEAAPVNSYEIIFINDGSRDDTAWIMDELHTQDKNTVIVDLSRNYGHQIALSAGLQQAQGDYIFVIDADLQDPPELLTSMLERARMPDGPDVVYGQREKRKGETAFKLFTSRAFYKVLSWLSDIPIPEDVGDFRLMKRRVLDAFLAMPEHQRFIRGMIAWIGFKQEAFLYTRDPRFAGVTKYPFHKLLQFALDAISGFSIKPLRVSILFAMIGIAIACLMALVAVWAHFADRSSTVDGWASLACLISFFASMQLICLGVIGEYVGRTYMEVKNRPLYVLNKVLRH
ncbi:MAG: glycosyltransferase family 2 protein [Alphaproteobacteria bacterium]|nr:glycosyltransferase family 2 protein [Alphaproteobacteria bacterium]MBU0859525.1 glycosyltransferase family 2 protein [Alphaproteobacteria bacterium]